MSRDYLVFLEDMLESCEKILRYTDGMSFERFTSEDLVFDAVARRLMVIGEAASRVSEEVRRRHDEVDWRKIVGLRNIVIHRYASVDEEILWDVVTNSVPVLRDQLAAVLKREAEGEGRGGGHP